MKIILKRSLGIILLLNIFPSLFIILDLITERQNGYIIGWYFNVVIFTVIIFYLLLDWCFK